MDAVDDGPRSLLRPVVLAWAVLASIALSFVVVVVTADGARSLSGRVGGDFPAFYGAGTIVLDGDVDQLYDFDRLVEAESGLLDEPDSAIAFPYVPPVAAVYSLLARLPYVIAYLVHTLLMAAAALGGFWLLRPLLPGPAKEPVVVAAVGLTFVPLFMAVTLGQNSALLLLLVAATWRFTVDGREVPAGLALGLLLFKPQYAVPLLGLLFLRRKWRTVGTVSAVAVLWWLAGALMLGASWVSTWVDQVGPYTARDAEVNGDNAISWLGMAEHLFGVGSTIARVLGGGLAAMTVVVLVVIWVRSRDERLGIPMAAAAAGALLISPHAMFYDASLVALSVAGMHVAGRAGLARLVLVGWIVGALHPLKHVIGMTPVGAVVVLAFGAAVSAARSPTTSAPPSPTLGHPTSV